MNSGEEVLTKLAFWVQAGQVHSGMDSIAMEGASNVKVPPWRMGNLDITKYEFAADLEKQLIENNYICIYEAFLLLKYKLQFLQNRTCEHGVK